MTWRLIRAWPDPEMQRKALWVAAMMDAAPPTAAKLRVTPLAIVAQSATETGWGAHLVGQHNLFGIKVGVGWTGARVLVHTREVFNGQSVMIDDWFRDYPSFAESIADHLSFLEQNSIYRTAGVFDGMGDLAYFYALQHAGYATDPNYAIQLNAVENTARDYFLRYMTDQPLSDSGPAADSVVAVAPPLVTPAKHRWLLVGMRGNDVLELQQDLGFKGDAADGWFGKDTRAAVMKFQNDNHLADVDGVVGDKTWAALDLKKAA